MSKTRKGSKHDKTGCLTCRARHKKCLEKSFPTCGSCARLNLACRWETVREVVSKPQPTQAGPLLRSPTQNTSLSLISLQTGWDLQTTERSMTPCRRSYMKYYIEVLAKILTSSHQYNSFLTAFLPMAMDSAALSDALVAFSAVNASAFDKSRDLHVLETRCKALSSLSSCIKETDMLQQETNLAACIVLGTADISYGRRVGWHEHFQGASQIILSASALGSNGLPLTGPDVFKRSSEGKWLLRNFAYHDILGSVMSNKGVLLNPDYISDMSDTIDSYYGVASGILISIAQISALDVDHSYMSPASEQHSIQTQALGWRPARSIEKDLRGWKCPNSTDPVLVSMANAYRSAALLYLYHRLRTSPWLNDLDLSGNFDTEKALLAEVKQTMYHLSQIPVDSCPEGSILFPLFLAGVTVTSTEDMETIHLRMHDILAKRGFRNMRIASQVLQEIWSIPRPANEAVWRHLSWAQMVEIAGEGLNLS